MPFAPVDPRQSFPELEKKVLEFWQTYKIFQQSIDSRTEEKSFSFYDGPPFATGLPHYGHLIQSAMKDVVPRYWTMKGYRVPRRFGWDCHGLPIENIIEKELDIKSKKDIETMGVATFNEACRSAVLRFTGEWEMYVGRLGRWVDFTNDYKTMTVEYMESVWWVFAELWKKGLIYEGRKSMHVCPRCSTPLANFEVALNYQQDIDPSVIVKFPVVGQEKTYFLAWTTTPWTLPGNILLAVKPDETYVYIQQGDETFILGKTRATEIFEGKEIAVLKEVPASELVGMQYEGLFAVTIEEGKCYTVVGADFVSTEDGTSIVHIAPAFGEDDLKVGQAEGAGFVQHVTMSGTISDVFPEMAGKDVWEINPLILKNLQERSLLFHHLDYEHSYPHCWRCDAKLLNYATTSWFVKVTAIKDQLIEQNNNVHWVPEHLQQGRFGDWLANARDWAISRNRYWGAPLPVWRCADCGAIDVMGSQKQLADKVSTDVPDLHKHFVDTLTWTCSVCNSGIMQRIPEVLDCWFESGAMPYASTHYPFEQKDFFEANFPADYIGEAIDQTRGWFYTLHVLGVALFGKPAYKNVTCTGLVLAEDGQKMSKRKQNYPDPMYILDTFGADSLRFYLMNSPVVQGEDLRFSEKELLELQRNFLLMLWNSYSFFCTYAKMHSFVYDSQATSSDPLDQWILSRLETTKERIIADMDTFHIYKATQHYQPFLVDCSKWYIRRSRKRFAEGNLEALQTLFTVLLEFTQLLAPFMPFVTEGMYQNLTGTDFSGRENAGVPSSVHLCDMPIVKESNKKEKLEQAMEFARNAVESGHRMRKDLGIKVRQPLQEATIVATQEYLSLLQEEFGKELLAIIADELNVKSVALATKDEGKEPDIQFDTVLTPALLEEGMVREFVRQVQSLRKAKRCALEDQIVVKIACSQTTQEMLLANATVIQEQVKASALLFEETAGEQVKLTEGHDATLFVEVQSSTS